MGTFHGLAAARCQAWHCWGGGRGWDQAPVLGVLHVWPEVGSGCRVLGGLHAALTLSLCPQPTPIGTMHSEVQVQPPNRDKAQPHTKHQVSNGTARPGHRAMGMGSSGCSSRDMEPSGDGGRGWSIIFPQCCLWEEFSPAALGLWLAGAQGSAPVAWQKREEGLWGLQHDWGCQAWTSAGEGQGPA